MYLKINRKEEVQPDILVNGEKIQIVPEFKYLGVILDSYLTFERHVQKIVCAVTPQLRNFTFLKSTTVSTLIINQHIRMLSEGPCDTGVMMLKIQHYITEINSILKYIKIGKLY